MKGTAKQIKWAEDILKNETELIERRIRHFEKYSKSFQGDIEYRIHLETWIQAKKDFETLVATLDDAHEIIELFLKGTLDPSRTENRVHTMACRATKEEKERVEKGRVEAKEKAEAQEVEETAVKEKEEMVQEENVETTAVEEKESKEIETLSNKTIDSTQESCYNKDKLKIRTQTEDKKMKKYEVTYIVTTFIENGHKDSVGNVTLYADSKKEAEEKFFLTTYDAITCMDENIMGCSIKELKEVPQC